jgi:hypothetical protein
MRRERGGESKLYDVKDFWREIIEEENKRSCRHFTLEPEFGNLLYTEAVFKEKHAVWGPIPSAATHPRYKGKGVEWGRSLLLVVEHIGFCLLVSKTALLCTEKG